MKLTQKILAGLGVVALTAGSLIGTPAKAQFTWGDTGGVGSSTGTFAETPGHGYTFREPAAPATARQPRNIRNLNASALAEYAALEAAAIAEGNVPVGGAPVVGGERSWLVEYYAERANCVAQGRCTNRKIEYSPRQQAWMNCKETFKFQDAHKICGGFPLR